MRYPPLLLAVSLLLGACSGSMTVQTGGGPVAERPSPSPAVKPRRVAAEPFDPQAPIPRRPVRLAVELKETTSELYRAIERWRAGDSGSADARAEAELLAIRHQRIYRALLDSPALYTAVRKRLPRRLAAFADNTVRAGMQLRTLVSPLDKPPDWKIYKPQPAKELLGYYRKAESRFDVPWYILASINFIETRFGRLLGPSSAGAMGPMQFMPATWAAYGNGGDVNDPHDAIMGAARYLAASGAPERMKESLWAYNHSDNYVRAISIYARQMKKDQRAFYIYYHWQVYVLTKKGDMQLSGPGASR